MKILQLCKKFPYPLKDGEAIAVTYLARAFAELGSEVTLLAMNTSKHWFDTGELPHDFDHYAAIHTAYVDNRIRPWPALRSLFSQRSYHIERFEEAAFADLLTTLLNRNLSTSSSWSRSIWRPIFQSSGSIRRPVSSCGRTMWNTKSGSAWPPTATP